MQAENSTPRWGNEGRDTKANAIFRTLAGFAQRAIGEGVWLDIGCGSGGIARALAPKVRSIVGIDPESWSTWGDAMHGHGNLKLFSGSCDVEALPLQEESADIVLCNQVYEHVGDPRRLILNIGRLLKPGGLCYFAGPNLLWPIEPHVFWPIVHWIPRPAAQRLMRSLGSKKAEELDAYSHPSWRLRRWFDEADLAVVDSLRARVCAGLVSAGHGTLSRLVATIPRPIFHLVEPLSPGFVYVLTKRDAA